MTIRRFGARPGAARRHRLRPGVYAVIRRAGGILLTVQADGTAAPELQLPGGGVDPGEQPLAALHREVLEETGWRIAAPRRVGAFRHFDAVPAGAFGPVPEGAGDGRIWAEKLCVVYAARAVARLGAPTEAGHVAVLLRPEDARLALASDGQRAMLERVLAAGPR